MVLSSSPEEDLQLVLLASSKPVSEVVASERMTLSLLLMLLGLERKFLLFEFGAVSAGTFFRLIVALNKSGKSPSFGACKGHVSVLLSKYPRRSSGAVYGTISSDMLEA